MTVISLTTIPPRFDLIGPALETLLAQKADIESIRLYVPQAYRRFPDYDGAAPKVPAGITLRRPAADLGPASKVLFCARELRGTGQSILFCDDDKLFPEDWAATLTHAAREYPGRAICLQGGHLTDLGFSRPAKDWGLPRCVRNSKVLSPRYIRQRVVQMVGNLVRETPRPKPVFKEFGSPGIVDFFEGFRGVLVKPEWFDDPCFDLRPITWAVDDMWLSGHLARRNVPIWVLAAPPRVMPVGTTVHHASPLLGTVIDGHDRQAANRACVRYFQETHGVWL